MSLIVERFLICDGLKNEGCADSENFGVDDRHHSTKAHRHHSVDYGWTTDGKRDWCIACTAKRKETSS